MHTPARAPPIQNGIEETEGNSPREYADVQAAYINYRFGLCGGRTLPVGDYRYCLVACSAHSAAPTPLPSFARSISTRSSTSAPTSERSELRSLAPKFG